jgi:hypothetical protein
VTQRTEQRPFAMTVPQASRYSGLGATTIYGGMRTDEIQTALIGRRRLVLTDSLEDFIRRHAGRFEPHPVPWQVTEDAPPAPKPARRKPAESGRRRAVTEPRNTPQKRPRAHPAGAG